MPKNMPRRCPISSWKLRRQGGGSTPWGPNIHPQPRHAVLWPLRSPGGALTDAMESDWPKALLQARCDRRELFRRGFPLGSHPPLSGSDARYLLTQVAARRTATGYPISSSRQSVTHVRCRTSGLSVSNRLPSGHALNRPEPVASSQTLRLTRAGFQQRRFSGGPLCRCELDHVG